MGDVSRAKKEERRDLRHAAAVKIQRCYRRCPSADIYERFKKLMLVDEPGETFSKLIRRAGGPKGIAWWNGVNDAVVALCGFNVKHLCYPDDLVREALAQYEKQEKARVDSIMERANAVATARLRSCLLAAAEAESVSVSRLLAANKRLAAAVRKHCATCFSCAYCDKWLCDGTPWVTNHDDDKICATCDDSAPRGQRYKRQRED